MGLPTRRKDVRVQLLKTAELLDVLPVDMRDLKLVFLVPGHFRPSSLRRRIRGMLQLKRSPCLRVAAGVLLDDSRTLDAQLERHGDSEGMLSVTADLRKECSKLRA